MPIKNVNGSWGVPVTTQAGAYTVQTRDFGSLILANGAMTATLPLAGPELNGVWVQFASISAGDLVIAASGSSDQLVVDADASADTITFGTSGEEIGSHVEALCDGTGWLIWNHLSDTDASKAIA
jgi:hypothetical protein